ncbi:MAG: hypothetical protein JSR93_06035 [Verrucomicrobia bacterium]|nr:hypothetical protein [Verrucomicrobiota bacterium]
MLAVFPILAALNFFSANTGKVDAENKTSSSTSNLDQGDQSLSSTSSEAYNHPAAVKLRDSWHIFATASYIYWFAGEEGLDLATSASYLSGTNTVIPSSHQGKTIFQNFEYSSGFKVGLGGNLCSDEWVLRADYTRLHLSTERSHSAPSSSIGVGALYATDWFYQTSPQGQGIAGRHLSSKWYLGLDWLDATLQRPFYSGRKLTLTPFIGLRTSWIEQNLNINVKGALNVSPPSSKVHSHNHLESWGIGPRSGIDARFLLGAGFRIQGELGASILYTQFSKVTHSENPFTSGASKVSYAMHDRQCVRTMAEASLGFGWGIYFSKNRGHFDFSATYDFNYLWSQNMMRTLNDIQIIGTGGGGYDLYLQGLTLAATFSF